MTETPPSTGGDAPPAIAAYFDLDKTIITKASLAAFRRPLYAGGLLNRRALFRALLSQVVYLNLGASEHRIARMRGVILRLTRGWSAEEVDAVVEEALAAIVEPIIYAEALELIEQHRTEGHLVVIVSASPQEIVVPLARHLGVEETISSQAALDEAGRYTGEMTFYAYGPHKADAIRAHAEARRLDLAASYAYSDSHTDLPMLETVGHPAAVNPDRALARIARTRDWEILNFVRPVRLRDQVRARVREAQPQRATVNFGAFVLAVAAVVLGWLFGRRSPSEGPVSHRGGDAPRRLRDRRVRSE